MTLSSTKKHHRFFSISKVLLSLTHSPIASTPEVEGSWRVVSMGFFFLNQAPHTRRRPDKWWAEPQMAVKQLGGFVHSLRDMLPYTKTRALCTVARSCATNIIYPSVSILNERYYMFCWIPMTQRGLTNQRSSSCISQDLESKPAKLTMFHHFQATRKNWNRKPQRVVPLSCERRDVRQSWQEWTQPKWKGSNRCTSYTLY